MGKRYYISEKVSLKLSAYFQEVNPLKMCGVLLHLDVNGVYAYSLNFSESSLLSVMIVHH